MQCLLAACLALDHAAPFANYVKAAEMYETTGHIAKPVSGKGSAFARVKPFIGFLEEWFAAHSDVRSMVEASCGHWPTGWQSHVRWLTRMTYTGVDILPKMIEANSAMLASAQKKPCMRHGGQPTCSGISRFASARFEAGDMINGSLPQADLLLTKDTLIHFSNEAIKSFIAMNVDGICPRRFRYVMFVHARPCVAYDVGKIPGCRWTDNEDIPLVGFHTLDLAAPPFSLPIKTVFRFHQINGSQSEHVVQVLELSPC